MNHREINLICNVCRQNHNKSKRDKAPSALSTFINNFILFASLQDCVPEIIQRRYLVITKKHPISFYKSKYPLQHELKGNSYHKPISAASIGQFEPYLCSCCLGRAILSQRSKELDTTGTSISNTTSSRQII